MFSRTRLIALAVIAASFCLPLTVRSQTKVPLTHEAMWMMKRVGAPNPSPDGKWVVFSLVEPAYDEKDQVSDLWIVATDGSAKPRRSDFFQRRRGGVAWSPDSRQIAFSARREGDEVNQIYVLDVADGGEAGARDLAFDRSPGAAMAARRQGFAFHQLSLSRRG